MVNLRIKPDKIMDHALGILTAIGVAGAAFIIANKFFGLDSYNGLSSEQIASVIKNLNDNYIVISHIQGKSIFGKDYVRGILSGQGGQMYYYRFDYENGAPTGIMLFPLYFETWSTQPNIFDTATLL